MNTLKRCPICDKPFGDDHQSCRLFEFRQYPYKMIMCYTHQKAVQLEESLLNHLNDQNAHDLLSRVKDYVLEDWHRREIYRFCYLPHACSDSISYDPKINVARLLD